MNTLARNFVILVDEQDVQIGVADKIIAHQQALLHRAFSIMLFRYKDEQLQFLLQQRALSKYHCGGLWTNTCCSHPQPNDNLQVSVLQRLQEELLDIAVEHITLSKVGEFIYQAKFDNGLTEHEYDHVFLAEYNDIPHFFNEDEIAELKWMSCHDIEELYSLHKNDFTPWFFKVYQLCKDELINNGDHGTPVFCPPAK